MNDEGNMASFDVDELINSVKQFSDSASGIHSGRNYSSKGDIPEVSVFELNEEYEIPFYYLIRDIAEFLNVLSKESKYQGKKIKKVHHDLLSINNKLFNLDNSMYISNLIKLYELGFIQGNVLINELDKTGYVKSEYINDNVKED